MKKDGNKVAIRQNDKVFKNKFIIDAIENFETHDDNAEEDHSQICDKCYKEMKREVVL